MGGGRGSARVRGVRPQRGGRAEEGARKPPVGPHGRSRGGRAAHARPGMGNAGPAPPQQARLQLSCSTSRRDYVRFALVYKKKSSFFFAPVWPRGGQTFLHSAVERHLFTMGATDCSAHQELLADVTE